jgi:uncharacterized protein
MMLDAKAIQSVAQRLAAAASSPAKIIVFGSYGRGDADEGSDLDLMVVERQLPDRGQEYLRLRESIGRLGVGVDLLVYSAQEFERRSLVPGTVPYWALTEGRIVHDASA